MKPSKLLLLSLTLLLALPAAPQQTHSNVAASASSAVPPLIPYSGVVSAVPRAQPAAGASITFLIYKDEQGGEPLFAETQTVALDAAGHYKAQLGATLTNGIPIDLFATGEARWIEVQVAGEAPQPRVLLVSVPYALKAADAATLGGLPPSAFALARPASEANGAVSPAITPNLTSNVTTTGGIAGYVPEFSGVSSVVDSPIFVSATGQVGIGTTTRAATLNVNGSTTLNGQLLLPATGTATAATGYNSRYFKIFSSAYNSMSKAVVNPRFEWVAEATRNNTAAPGATLNLLSSTTASNASETGFYFNSNGTIHFAPGQTFPGGTGTGTITGVTAGTALTGGGASGKVTLNLDTTKVPLLAASNSFAGNQTITGNLGVSGTASAGVVNAATGFDLGGLPFAFGSPDAAFGPGIVNIYFGFAGNSSTTSFGNAGIGISALAANTTGAQNTASGEQALYSNTSASGNTADGFDALWANTTGYSNTASGEYALESNTKGHYNVASGVHALHNNSTGSSNVGIGYSAGITQDDSAGIGSNNTMLGSFTSFGTGSITNATAIGAWAEVLHSNTMVLGCIYPLDSCPATVNVGIGTADPDSLLTVNGQADKPGGGSWSTFSDGRLKTVNGNFGSGLGQVMQLRPIRYRYKPDNALGIRDADEHIGVVAQEVQRVIPEAVTENGKGYLLVNNDPIIWSMVNAIKQQQREIEQQQKLLRAQRAAMQSLVAEVRETRKTLRQVKAQAAAGQLKMVAAR